MLVVAVILGVTLHSYVTNRSGVLALARNMFIIQQAQITQQVSDYLGPAPATAAVAQDILTGQLSDQPPQTFMAYGASMLRHVPQVESFYLSDDTGAFWFIDRNPAGMPAGMEWVHLMKAGDRTVFRHWYYNDRQELFRTEDVDAKGYDPRVRAWYTGAAGAKGLYWANPYPIRETGQFVVTASTKIKTSNGHMAIFAINISLNRLTEFLAGIRIGNSGQAIIVDTGGHVVAGHEMLTLAKKADWDFGRMTLDPQRQLVFERTLAMYHVYGAGPRIVHARGEDYVTIASPLEHGRQRGWILLLNAPEHDFAAFTRVAGRQNLVFSLLIVVLAAILAGFLVRQSRKTERIYRVLQGERAQRRGENQALGDIAAQPDLFDPNREMPILTVRTAELAKARRVSLWRFLGDDDRLLCEDAYDRDEDAHSTGVELSHGDLAPFFDMIRAGELVATADAANDDRFKVFQRLYMRGFGSNAVVIVPINARGRVMGMVALEDAELGRSSGYLAGLIGGIAAVRFVAAGTAQEHDDRPAARIAPGEPVDVHFEEGFLLAPHGDPNEVMPPGRYPMVSIATISFGDATSQGPQNDFDLLPLVQEIAAQVQDIAREHRLYSVQIIGHRLYLVGGIGKEPDRGAVLRLADAVLAIREACLIKLADADVISSFRIGLDVGNAIGATLGHDPGLFNLWGDALQKSELLAESLSDAGTIQVSEAAYILLRDAYLFRPRGLFYLPRSGVTRSYIMAGRR